jgi:hypothetical protein
MFIMAVFNPLWVSKAIAVPSAYTVEYVILQVR